MSTPTRRTFLGLAQGAVAAAVHLGSVAHAQERAAVIRLRERPDI